MPDSRHADARLVMWYCPEPGSCKLPFCDLPITRGRIYWFEVSNHACGLMALIAHTSKSERMKLKMCC